MRYYTKNIENYKALARTYNYLMSCSEDRTFSKADLKKMGFGKGYLLDCMIEPSGSKKIKIKVKLPYEPCEDSVINGYLQSFRQCYDSINSDFWPFRLKAKYRNGNEPTYEIEVTQYIYTRAQLLSLLSLDD